ncbi:hypothetical protein Tco_0656769 [Tanacetum coccineum]|uniref:Uncharacterized protein n=1 Tax=Tanacetum coccineum TaxID=301880 RepID=A0ABQ4XAD2_9ASTR
MRERTRLNRWYLKKRWRTVIVRGAPIDTSIASFALESAEVRCHEIDGREASDIYTELSTSACVTTRVEIHATFTQTHSQTLYLSLLEFRGVLVQEDHKRDESVRVSDIYTHTRVTALFHTSDLSVSLYGESVALVENPGAGERWSSWMLQAVTRVHFPLAAGVDSKIHTERAGQVYGESRLTPDTVEKVTRDERFLDLYLLSLNFWGYYSSLRHCTLGFGKIEINEIHGVKYVITSLRDRD